MASWASRAQTMAATSPGVADHGIAADGGRAQDGSAGVEYSAAIGARVGGEAVASGRVYRHMARR